MRSICNGAITVGLATVPVKVYSATQNHDGLVHQVRDNDGGAEVLDHREALRRSVEQNRAAAACTMTKSAVSKSAKPKDASA